MKKHNILIPVLCVLAGLIGCQQRITVIKARLVERESVAVESLSPAPSTEPAALRHYSNGLALLAAGDSVASAQQFHLTVASDSSVWSAHYLLGLLVSSSDSADSDGCLDHFRDALRFAPTADSVRSRIYVAMAACYERQSALLYAEQCYRTALKLDPISESARQGLHRILSQRQANE